MIDVTQNKVTAEFRLSELDTNQGATSVFRAPLAYVKYPKNEPNLDESGVSGDLGKIVINFEVDTKNFFPNDGSLTVKNFLDVRVKETDYEVEFKPCDLDLDGDGFISSKDVEGIYKDFNKVPKKFDLNNDGLINQLDVELAQEYIGFICGNDAVDDDEEAIDDTVDDTSSEDDTSGEEDVVIDGYPPASMTLQDLFDNSITYDVLFYHCHPEYGLSGYEDITGWFNAGNMELFLIDVGVLTQEQIDGYQLSPALLYLETFLSFIVQHTNQHGPYYCD
tara:strand:- start:55 stop:888 length:834 start_codon:yes stop_codon:yes gene_type:complete